MQPMSDETKRRQIEAIYQKVRQSFPEVPEATVEEFQNLKDKDEVVVVDVRSAGEQAVSMIPGAVTSRQFEEHQEDYKGFTVLAHCTVGGRSGLYAKDLQAKGWKVFNLKGAILAWTHAGGPLVDPEGPTRRVHVYSSRFNLVAEGYDAVW